MCYFQLINCPSKVNGDARYHLLFLRFIAYKTGHFGGSPAKIRCFDIAPELKGVKVGSFKISLKIENLLPY